jgi:octaprenyl-diphosphate synthase
LRSALEHGDGSALPEVQAAIRATGGLDYSRECAIGYARAAQQAIDGLADNAHAAALRGLARYAVERDR